MNAADREPVSVAGRALRVHTCKTCKQFLNIEKLQITKTREIFESHLFFVRLVELFKGTASNEIQKMLYGIMEYFEQLSQR